MVPWARLPLALFLLQESELVSQLASGYATEGPRGDAVGDVQFNWRRLAKATTCATRERTGASLSGAQMKLDGRLSMARVGLKTLGPPSHKPLRSHLARSTSVCACC